MHVRHSKSGKEHMWARIQKTRVVDYEKPDEVSFMYGIVIHISVCIVF